MTEDQDPQREYVEARVRLPDHMIEEFLDYCQEELDQMPELRRLGEDVDGEEWFELRAAQEEDRLQAAVPPQSRN